MNISIGDNKKAMESMDKKAFARKGASESKLEMGLATLSKKLNAADCGGLKEVSILSEESRGNAYSVTVELVCTTGKKTKNTDSVVKRDGKWLITPE